MSMSIVCEQKPQPPVSNHALPIAVIDAASLISLSQAQQNYDGNAMVLLDPLTQAGRCTLLIPRCAIQETLKGQTIEGRNVEVGPTRRSGNPALGYRAYLPKVPLLRNNSRIIKSWLDSWQNHSPPALRYYPSPEALIENGELTARRGGIVIFDTSTECKISPLNDSGMYHFNCGSNRGDDQILELRNAIRQHAKPQNYFPVISEDHNFLITHIDRQLDDSQHPELPFPLTLRLLLKNTELHGDHSKAALENCITGTKSHWNSTNHQQDFERERQRRSLAFQSWNNGIERTAPDNNVTQAELHMPLTTHTPAAIGK